LRQPERYGSSNIPQDRAGARLTNNFSAKNTAAQVMYFNQAHRWNWGFVGGQIPYLSGGFDSAVGTVGGEPVEVDRSIIFRQTERSAGRGWVFQFNLSSGF
jgi:hypothetical protein